VISYYHRRLQTSCDENVITTDSLLPRPKSTSDGLYEPLVIGLNVVVALFYDYVVVALSNISIPLWGDN